MLFGGLEEYEGLLVWIGVVVAIHYIDKFKWTGINVDGTFMQVLFATYLFAGYCALYTAIPLAVIKVMPALIIWGIPFVVIPVGLILFQSCFPRHFQVRGLSTYITGTFTIYFGVGLGYALVGMGAMVLMILAYVILFALFGPGNLGRRRW